MSNENKNLTNGIHLKSTVILTMSNGCVYANGIPFVVDFPDEPFDRIEDNKLVTIFRGHLENFWSPEQIEGYLA